MSRAESTTHSSQYSSIITTIMTSNVNISDDYNIDITNSTSAPTVGTIRDENLALVEVATLGTLFVLIVFGNCCVLLALALRPLKMTRMYYFLLHLCISDLITGFCTVLPQLAWDITYRFYGGNVLCKIVKLMQILGPYLSSYVLVVTAVDRYQAICFPLSNCSWTPRRSKLMISCAWIISIMFCLPQAFIFSYQEIPFTNGVYDCWGTFPQPFGERVYVTWYAVSVFFIPLIVLIFTHFYICREIWVNVSLKRKTDKREKQLNNKQTNNRLNSSENHCSSIRRGRKCLIIGIDRVVRLATRRAPTDSCTQSTPNSNENRTQTDGSDDEIPDQCRPKHSVVTFQESAHSPRVNTVNRLSRAKIKTVKITVVVILCYIICSSPFIFVQLWAYWMPSAQDSAFWTGPIITILMLLSSLNSFVNPFIYLYFNQNLVKSLLQFCCRIKFNENFIISKTNASELNSNYNNYENRIDTQSSVEDTESLRVNRNGNMIPLKHDFPDSDNQLNLSPKSSRIRNFRNRRLNNNRNDSHFDTNAFNI